MAKVYHQEIYGLREDKYDWLNNHNISNVEWEKLEPQSEFYLFKPLDTKNLAEYHSFKKITEIFSIYGVGITTARDKFVTDTNKNNLLNRIRLFKNSKLNDNDLHRYFSINKKLGWNIRKAWTILQNISDNDLSSYLCDILYRPFDKRIIFYHDSLVWRTAKRVMSHMLDDNLGIIVSRQLDKSNILPAFISDFIIDAHSITSAVSISYQFPLYLYPETDKKDLFSKHEPGDKKPNIKPEIFAELKNNFQKDVSPEEIFYYIYAVLYSNIYRKKYKEFLKIDFPRIPFTKDYDRFITLSELGKRLADLHLLKSRELDESISKFPIAGSNKVENVRYLNDIVWINKEQYFDGIKEEVWQYQIGGYQVCDKWLKDRKGRTLSVEEIRTYCKIVTALSKTIALQNEIDTHFEY